MKQGSALGYASVALVCGALAVQPARAEDTKGKWQFGFGLSYYATTDYIRSNSDVAVSASVAGQEGSLPTVIYVDDRPDQNMLNEPSVRDNFKWDFNASYGLTRWLALELAAGYMKTAVGNIEYYVVDREKFIGSAIPSAGTAGKVCGPTMNGQCFRYPNASTGSSVTNANEFISVGDFTEIPLQLSALVRFRPESPLDPYVGLGVGYIFTDFQASQDFSSLNSTVESLHVTSAFGGEVDRGELNRQSPQPGFTPGPLQAEISDGFEYHVVGGVDYFFNEHTSMYVDARYVWSETSVDITTDGSHQVRMVAFYPGHLQTFQVGSVASPNYWEDTGFTGCKHENGNPCSTDQLLASEDGNGNGTLDPLLGEGKGVLYFYPAGPNPNRPDGVWTAADAVETYNCPTCSWAQATPTGVVPDSEDRNNNRYTDRFFLYGVDVCSLADAATNPQCAPGDITALPQYVWPGGCSLAASDPTTPHAENEGCPRPPNISDVTQTPADDTQDTHIIQGGEIKLGGFSLGVGFKFTF